MEWLAGAGFGQQSGRRGPIATIYFPEMVGDLALETVLSEQDAAVWFTHVAPPQEVTTE
ncbi:hypothetical protein AB0H00_30715 [Nocardia sp. NPDC023852]|uniref:hypothetical protein n=1 Tax=Nocardia sp. NPDC023852 TaxID=3154697 RepID=UPI0033D4B168